MYAQPDPPIAEAVARLRRGELVVIPTETVYGLAADARNPDAVRHVFALKGRPASRPLIVHLARAGQLADWACDVPDYAWALARRYWPGPLTLVLPRRDVSDEVTAGQDTVALRVPDHPLTLAVLEAFGGGVAAPSANRYGRLSPTTAEHVRRQFGPQTPLILDGGPCTVGIESTIVACVEPRPRILRPGSISARDLESISGLAVATVGEAESGLRVPGQSASHYAPRTPTVLVPRGALPAWRAAHSGACAFLGFQPPPFPTLAQRFLPPDAEGAARTLYAALHELDAAGADWLVVEQPPPDTEWAAVRDRLCRAVAGQERQHHHRNVLRAGSG